MAAEFCYWCSLLKLVYGKVIRVRQLLYNPLCWVERSIFLGAPQRLVMRQLEDMGLETLQGRRDKSKLKVWYKLASMSEDR